MTEPIILFAESSEDLLNRVRDILTEVGFRVICFDHIDYGRTYAGSPEGSFIALYLIASTVEIPNDGLEWVSELHGDGEKVIAFSSHKVSGVPNFEKFKLGNGEKLIAMIRSLLAN